MSAFTVKSVGTDYDKITGEVSILLSDTEAYETMSRAVNPYGDGLVIALLISDSAHFIVQMLYFRLLKKEDYYVKE